jgi:hypothetical protein
MANTKMQRAAAMANFYKISSRPPLILALARHFHLSFQQLNWKHGVESSRRR